MQEHHILRYPVKKLKFPNRFNVSPCDLGNLHSPAPFLRRAVSVASKDIFQPRPMIRQALFPPNANEKLIAVSNRSAVVLPVTNRMAGKSESYMPS